MRRLAARGALALGLRGLWALLNYLSVLMLARWLAPGDYGLFAQILSAVILLAMVGALGSQTALLRFLGEYKGAGALGRMAGVVAHARARVLAASGALSLGAIALVWAGHAAGRIEAPIAWSLGLLLVPGWALNDTHGGIARSFGGLVVALAPRDILWRAGLIGIGFAVTRLAPPDWQLPLLLGAAVALLWGVIAWQGRAALARLPDDVRHAAREDDRDGWRRVAGPIWLASVAMVSLRALDVVILGLLLPAPQVGAYFAAARTAALVGFVLMSVNLIAGPQIAAAYHAGQSARLRRLLAAAALASFAPALALVVIYAFFGAAILGTFGAGFAAAWPVLMILSAGQLVSAFFGSVGLLLNLAGQERANTRIVVICGAGSSLGMVLGGLAFGAAGTALAVAAGLSLWNAWQWRHARAVLGLDASVLGLGRARLFRTRGDYRA